MRALKTAVLLLGAVSGLSVQAGVVAAQVQSGPAQPAADWRETYAYTVGMQAVICGWPIVKNATVRYHMIEKPNGQADMPLNTWFHSRRAQDYRDKIHSSVTADLLYSAAWFDVSREPLVITVPDSPSLYYGIQMMEMYSDIFAYVGTRATGGKAGKHLPGSIRSSGRRKTGACC